MSKIEWTDESWNPVVGCTKVSPGCDNCYAERMAYRLACMGQKKYQAVISTDGGAWNHKTFCDVFSLEIPLHWKKPRLIFVCSMGDLFHPSVPFEFIDKVYSTMLNCHQHTFQVLTKRPERMLEYYRTKTYVVKESDTIWLGVTAENQEQADKRIPILLQIPAAVKFVSIEPMLEKIILKPSWLGIYTYFWPKTNLDWVIVGAESGPGARYCSHENIWGVVKQCKASGVAVFVKQIHNYPSNKAIKDINQFPPDLQIREYPYDRALA